MEVISKIKEEVLEKKLFRNSMLMIIAYIFNKAIAFIMMPIFTRLMSTEDYGIVSTYVAWVSVLAYILGLSLEYSVRNAYLDYEKKLESYISSICVLSVCNFGIIGVCIWIINSCIFHYWTGLMCVCCLIHAYVHALINLVSQKFTMTKQYKKRAAMLIVPNLFASLLGVVLVISMDTDKYWGRILGYVLIFAPIGIAVLATQITKGRTGFVKEYWKYGIAISLPMVFHGLSNVVLGSSDKIILQYFRGDSETGIYSLAYSCGMVPNAIVVALENLWLPWFTKKMQERNSAEINRVLSWYLKAMTVMLGVILLVSADILKIMSPRNYWSGVSVLPLIMVSNFFIFLYSISIHLELFYKANKFVAVNTFMAAIVNIVLDVLLSPKYGMIGAAVATLISYICLFFVHYAYSKRLEKELFPFGIYILPIILAGVCTVLSYVFMEHFIVRWMLALVLTGIFAWDYMKHKDVLKIM